MTSTLNYDLLAGMIKEKRGKKGLRDTSTEIGGVSPATLSRIEQGKVPDVDTFIKICKWLDTPTDTFIVNHSTADIKSNKEHIIAHLRAERELEPSTVQMLVQMIDMAYAKK
jgi:transcriptional regulator with XRE-family HTH domain